jgi:hypothetical protein
MLFLLFSTLLYFLPTLIGRHKVDATGIFVVNLLFGWTVVGWIIALVWACTAQRHAAAHYGQVSSGRFCCQCGGLTHAGGHFCAGCGRAVC